MCRGSQYNVVYIYEAGKTLLNYHEDKLINYNIQQLVYTNQVVSAKVARRQPGTYKVTTVQHSPLLVLRDGVLNGECIEPLEGVEPLQAVQLDVLQHHLDVVGGLWA